MRTFGMLARLKSRPQCSSMLLRSFSSNAPKLDLDSLFANVLTKEERQNLKSRMDKMDQDSYKQAMSTQLPELGYQVDRLMKKMPTHDQEVPPSRSTLMRQNTSALRTLRLEVYNRAISEGMDRTEARDIATKAVGRAASLFKQKTDKTVDKIKQEADRLQSEKDQFDETQQKLLEFASKRIQELYAVERSARTELDFTTVEPDPNAPKIFGNTTNALNIFDTKELKPMPTSYWAAMERRKTEITNLSMGPTNAFEEQIQWTEQGRMWPYPIDNEYLMGVEEKIHFTEHIFLGRYLAKHKHLPKTGPIAHFMELVCVGLSKNPYMTLEKKHMHLDSFAEFFSPQQIEKVHRLHEEAEKQVA